MPKNSAVGPAVGVAGAATAFALVWHIWWLVVLGVLAVVATVIARSFVRDVHRVIPAEEVERVETAWRDALARATPILRALETTSANRGRADVAA